MYAVEQFLLVLPWVTLHSEAALQPNIVFFVADDLGFGDLASYGHPTQEWGAIDDLASKGIRFTQAYAASSFCTPSRASFLTGRLPHRTGMYGPMFVLYASSSVGLPHSEVTMAELLKTAGYRTGMVGKWHLGMNAHNHSDGSNLPHNHGFDFVGTFLPYTLNWLCDHWQRHIPHAHRGASYLYQNDTISEQPIQLDTLTERLVQDAQTFIHTSIDDDERFFLYFPFPQTHTPMFNNAHFKGKSKRGVYGDQVNEMAWGVEQILDTLKETGVDNNTLVVFISDQGPHLEVCQEGGSTGPMKGGKGFFFEGSIRVPMIAYWPGTLPPRRDSTVVSLMDLFPTFASLSGAHLPTDRHIDGLDITPLLFPETAAPQSPRDLLTFYHESILLAVRYGSFKIHFYDLALPSDELLVANCRGTYPIINWMEGETVSRVKLPLPKIYNVEEDPREMYQLPIEDYTEMLGIVDTLIAEHEETLTDIPEPLLSKEFLSKLVIPCCNYPYCVC
ncbi:hypothetical protein CAPTEDRAFT_212288 [Capitella teleta]|uniref:Sulfatase N-terminal domain-containing protein n=1 Tax=Capitella teleta TaxID=283909 RepID=R7UAX4_CAPTE|nr:hypothetical protein CAPTEDRAFT_212288 [Capitella teleta]|eukprot:ELU03286.1 hypothetical protein CAPTEDRAFT_212288 [Capitella teleta]